MKPGMERVLIDRDAKGAVRLWSSFATGEGSKKPQVPKVRQACDLVDIVRRDTEATADFDSLVPDTC